ncbi:MAG: hypothetical protein JOZ46_01340 [Candidatus Dormibacteraeota bacterium]|nr:hypothetical protein [Candidatus Dormibacteraeota bacterium]MBV9524438.1 hypothetical protein [Candidatus Dormibacteraeota bacterium]
MTESYLCSAPREGGSVPRDSWSVCARDYLKPQVELLADRAIVACGAKAEQRLREVGARFLRVGAVAPPGCNRSGVREGWQRIPGYIAECQPRSHA